ncbi:MAG: class II glutamine amidotransferase [Endomicrobiia bacterium]
MCRLFGLIANKEVDVKFSMFEAENNFKSKAKGNPDGWGVGWYENAEAKVEKYPESAFLSSKFDEVVKELKSKIIVAHVRLASNGRPAVKENSHPFVYKNWIFAHNGTINKQRIKELLNAPYNLNFTSEPIDSEVYFRYILQCVEEESDFFKGLKKALLEVTKDDDGANFVMSDGKKLYAFCWKYSLWYLERNPQLPFHAKSKQTLALIESKRLAKEKAVLVASEKVTTDENWLQLQDGEFLKVNESLEVTRINLI